MAALALWESLSWLQDSGLSSGLGLGEAWGLLGHWAVSTGLAGRWDMGRWRGSFSQGLV